MSRFASIRQHPALSRYFDAVHPLFWPVLVWQLKAIFNDMQTRGCASVLLRLHWWGWLEVTFWGDRMPDPSAYKPIDPTRPHWTDPAWESAAPAIFISFNAASAILPRPRVKRPNGVEAACALAPIADTS